MTVWLIIISSALLTYSLRLSFIALYGKLHLSELFLRTLRFVPPAVLAGIIFPQVFAPGKALDVSLGNERIFAALLAAIAAWYTRNVFFTILSGMTALWIISAL